MRIVFVAIGLVVLLAMGWVLKGLMSDGDERNFTVHYSWIVKWALSLSRETHRAPDGAVFVSPRIEVAGHPNRWIVSGRLTWRDALDQPMDEPYTAVVENVCEAYADPDCWRLEDFATGDAAVDLAETALSTGPTDLAGAEPPFDPNAPVQQSQTEATEQPDAPPDPVLSLLKESAPPTGDGAVPEAPSLPLADGIPLPERKPPTPNPFAEEDIQFALLEPDDEATDLDPVTTLQEPALLEDEADTGTALADSGVVAADADSAAATVDSAEPVGDEDSAVAPAETGDGATEADTAAVLVEPYPIGPADTDEATDVEPAVAAAPQALPGTLEWETTPEAAAPAPAPQIIAALPRSAPAPQPSPDPALVALIQDRLGRAGYDPGPVDGRFGARTQGALIAFERDAGLPVTGQPSRTALAALEQRLANRNAASPSVLAPAPAQAATTTAPARAPGQPVNLIQPAPSRVPTTASDESLIFLIQHRLRTAGYSPGRFDGRINEGTVNAIRAYQADRGLPVNGTPSRALLDRLESEVLQNRQTEQPAPTPLGFNSCVPGAGVDCALPPA